MIDTEPTTLEVGTTGYVYARITDRRGEDLTSVGFELATVDPAGAQSDWAAPAGRDDALAAAGVVRVAVLHTAATPGYWKLRYRATDNPETIVGTAGVFRVVDG
ncbi:hypothetical protein ABZX12_18665 [Kribbella sp. NPDC003505]|uniref:hypothetical protein n=1 Tax=Kribbella sp. NPDC003505 TaxID=3154448 RepID=UPI0033AE167C